MLLYSLRKKLDLLWCVFKVQPYIVAIPGLDAFKHSRDYALTLFITSCCPQIVDHNFIWHCTFPFSSTCQCTLSISRELLCNELAGWSFVLFALQLIRYCLIMQTTNYLSSPVLESQQRELNTNLKVFSHRKNCLLCFCICCSLFLSSVLSFQISNSPLW